MITENSLELEKDILCLLAKKYSGQVNTGKAASLLPIHNPMFIGIPKLVEYGVANRNQDYLVMSLHGDKVDFMKEYHRTKIEHNRIMDIAQQIVRCIQKVHSVGYVHCDIKPHNILYTNSEEDQFDEALDSSLENKYTLIDYGICSTYLNDNGSHISKEKVTKFRGSVEFCAADILAQYSK